MSEFQGIRECTVIGAGPAGSMAADILASRGHSVTILEGKKEIGKPIQCGEAVSENTLRTVGIPPDDPIVKNSFKGYRIVSPSGNSLFSSTRGFNIRRDLFDRELASRAVMSGASIRKGESVIEIREEDGIWKLRTGKGSLRSRTVVMACGMNQFLVGRVSPGSGHKMMKALGVKIDRRDDSRELVFHVKGAFEGGYVWYFPRGDEVNIGVVSMNNIKNELDRFMESEGMDPRMIKGYHGGYIPISGMKNVNIDNSCIMVGDAGGFANPVSKGGIIGAIISGREGGMALSEKLSGNDEALNEWERDMITKAAFSPRNLESIEILSSLDDSALDQLTELTDGRDIWTMKKTELLRGGLKRPHLRDLLRGSFKLVRGSREWAMWAF